MASERRVGSLFITDHPTDPIEIECQKCGRKGRYLKATLIEKYGSDPADGGGSGLAAISAGRVQAAPVV